LKGYNNTSITKEAVRWVKQWNSQASQSETCHTSSELRSNNNTPLQKKQKVRPSPAT